MTTEVLARSLANFYRQYADRIRARARETSYKIKCQVAENSLTTSGAAKKVPPSLIIVVPGFKNNSKERHIFSEFKHGFLDKNGEQNKQKWKTK